MVKGKASIEVYMGDKFLFPYDYLNELENELKNRNKYNIYYVLKGPRLRIESLNILDDMNCIVEICNLLEDERMEICVNANFSFQVPDLSYIDLKIENNGSVLQIDFNEKGMEYLQEYEAEYLERKQEIVKEYGHIRWQFHVMFLRDMSMGRSSAETIDEYEVLYIGQSQKETIYERLYGHNTIPEISRYLNRENDGEKYDIYILVTGVHIKYFKEYGDEQYLTRIISSQNLSEDFLIKEGLITRSEVINIAEAILILFFKPEYNIKLKNSKKPEELTAYRIFKECLINPITYSMDLYFEDRKNKMVLKTDTIKTEYKQNVIKCEFDEMGRLKDILLEHFPVDLYL